MRIQAKKTGLLTVFILSLLFVGLKADSKKTRQDGINFAHMKFSEALALAKKENKLVFIDAYTTWCGPCKLMARTVFTEKQVGDYYNSHFVNLKMDMETSEGMFLAKQYSVQAYPTYLFIKPNGELVKRNMGATNSEKFIAFGKAAVSSANN